MADIDSERDRRVRELLSDSSGEKDQLAVMNQAQSEIGDIQSELRNHLAMEQAQDQARLQEAQTISQAAQGMMEMEGQDQLQGQVSVMNPQTQAALGKYGVKPGRTQNTSRNQSSGRTMTKTGDTTNIKNENITNNHTEIRVTQPSIPISQPSISVQSQPRKEDNTSKFKAWLSGMFAKQENEAEVQRKEYRKKEWNLGRTTSRLMKRIAEATSGLASRLDPKNMTSSLGGQLKWLLLIFGATMIGKVWKPTMKFLANLEAGFRSVFGLPINGDLRKSSAGTISVIDQIKGFIGIKKGENDTLIGGIGKVFMQGIDKLINKLKFWFEDRANALKDVEFPNIKTPSFGLLGPVMAPLMEGLTDTFKGLTQYLGDLITVALGGTKGKVKVAARKVERQAQEVFTDTTGKQTSAGDSGLIGGKGRTYMRDSDYDMFGNLKSNASSTQAMSRSLVSLFNDKSGKAHTAEIGTGVGQLFNVAKRSGQVVIDPELLQYLGLSPADVLSLQRNKQLHLEKYRIIGVRPTTEAQKNELASYKGSINKWGAAATGGAAGAAAGIALGSIIPGLGNVAGGIIGGLAGTFIGGGTGAAIGMGVDKYARDRSMKGLYPKLVKADSGERGADGSLGVPKMMWVLTKEGADVVTAKFTKGMSNKDMDITNREFYSKLRKIEERYKRLHNVTGPITQNIPTNELQTYEGELDAYNKRYYNEFESNDPNSANMRNYGNWNTMVNSVKSAFQGLSSFAAGGLRSFGNWSTTERLTGKQVISRSNYLMNELIKEGLTEEQAAGVAGNIMRESGFRTNLAGDYNTSFGIAQWHNERNTAYNTDYGASGRLVDASYEDQVKYLLWEAKKNGSLNAVKQAKNYTDAVDIWERKFEVSADYNKNGNIIRKRYAAQALNSYRDSKGEAVNKNDLTKQEGFFGKGTKLAGDILDKVADTIEGKTTTNATSELPDPTAYMTEKQKKALEKVVRYNNATEESNRKTWQNLGARTDIKGTYFQSGDIRTYVRTDGEHSGLFGLREDDIDWIERVDKNGKVSKRQLTDDEFEIAKKAAILNSKSILTNYQEKTKGKGYNDFMTDEKGKPIGYSIGRFKDIDNFSDQAKEDFGGSIAYIIYPSKDMKRWTMIGIPVPIRSKVGSLTEGIRTYGPIIYHKGAHWYKIDPRGPIAKKKVYSDWQPICQYHKVNLTPNATIEALKLLNLMNEIGKIVEKNGKLYTEGGRELTDEEIGALRQYGIVNNEWGRRAGVKEQLQKYNSAVGTAQKLDKDAKFRAVDQYIGQVGKTKKEREEYYKAHKDAFTVVNGVLYDSEGIAWGSADKKGDISFYGDKAFRDKIVQEGDDTRRHNKNEIAVKHDIDLANQKGYVSRDAMAKFLTGMSSYATRGGKIKKERIKGTAGTLKFSSPNWYSTKQIKVPYTAFIKSDGSIFKYKVTWSQYKNAIDSAGYKNINDFYDEGQFPIEARDLNELSNQIYSHITKLTGSKARKHSADRDALAVDKAQKDLIRNGQLISDIKPTFGAHGVQSGFKVIFENGSTKGYPGAQLTQSELDTLKNSVNGTIAYRNKQLRDQAADESFKSSGIDKIYKSYADSANKGDMKYLTGYGNYVATTGGDLFGYRDPKTGKVRALTGREARDVAINYFNTEGNRADFLTDVLDLKTGANGKKYYKVGNLRTQIDTSKDLNNFMSSGINNISVGAQKWDGKKWVDIKDDDERKKALEKLRKPVTQMMKNSGLTNKLIKALSGVFTSTTSAAAKVRVKQLNAAVDQKTEQSKSNTYLKNMSEYYAQFNGTLKDLQDDIRNIDNQGKAEKRANETFTLKAEEWSKGGQSLDQWTMFNGHGKTIAINTNKFIGKVNKNIDTDNNGFITGQELNAAGGLKKVAHDTATDENGRKTTVINSGGNYYAYDYSRKVYTRVSNSGQTLSSYLPQASQSE